MRSEVTSGWNIKAVSSSCFFARVKFFKASLLVVKRTLEDSVSICIPFCYHVVKY